MRQEFETAKGWITAMREHGRALNRLGVNAKCSDGCPCGEAGAWEEFYISAEPSSAEERRLLEELGKELGV